MSNGWKGHYNVIGVVSHIGGSSCPCRYITFVRKPPHEKAKLLHMDDFQASEILEKSMLNNQVHIPYFIFEAK